MSTSWLAEDARAAGYAGDTPLAVGVSRPTAEPLRFAQGLALDGTPFGCDSVAYAASLAKQVTGACAALLERDGVLDPDAPIAAWLPELPAWSERIRVRHLLHHTGALPDVWPAMERAGESDWTTDGVLAALGAVGDLDREPGTAFAYSSVGYVCLAAVIERAARSELDTFARTRMFEPLGMTSTCFWTGPSPAPPTAAVVPEPRTPAPLTAGDGGLWTSVHDLLRWNAAVLADALGIATRLHSTGTLDDGTPLDYAWGVRVFRASGETIQSHGGCYESATAKLVRLPDRSAGFAALAGDGSVDRMVALADTLQEWLIAGSARRS